MFFNEISSNLIWLEVHSKINTCAFTNRQQSISVLQCNNINTNCTKPSKVVAVTEPLGCRLQSILYSGLTVLSITAAMTNNWTSGLITVIQFKRDSINVYCVCLKNDSGTENVLIVNLHPAVEYG